MANIFPIPFFYEDVSGEEFNLIQNEISNGLPRVLNSDLDNPWGDTVKTTFKYKDQPTNDAIKHYGLAHLARKISSYKNIFCMTFDYDPNKFDTYLSWFNFSSPGNFQFDHMHDGADISGVYYYKTNGKDGNIIFTNPNGYMLSTLFPNSSSNKTLTITPKEGKLILFPSWLMHRVEVNNTKDTRISIAFNIKNINK